MIRYKSLMDIVGYHYRADLYCPRCTIHELVDQRVASPGAWDMNPEDALDQIADANGIFRGDEYSFDSDDFPKVVLGIHLEGEEVCGRCHFDL
jgi:hypothetical protein